MSLGTVDHEGEYQKGVGQLDEAIETLTFGLPWQFDAPDQELILSTLKNIQFAIENGTTDLLREGEIPRDVKPKERKVYGKTGLVVDSAIPALSDMADAVEALADECSLSDYASRDDYNSAKANYIAAASYMRNGVYGPLGDTIRSMFDAQNNAPQHYPRGNGLEVLNRIHPGHWASMGFTAMNYSAEVRGFDERRRQYAANTIGSIPSLG